MLNMATMRWCGRRYGGGRYGGDDATSASSAGEMRRQTSCEMWGFSVVIFTALLPSLVASQTMECHISRRDYVKSSTGTLALLNGLADGVATFKGAVCPTFTPLAPHPPRRSTN